MSAGRIVLRKICSVLVVRHTDLYLLDVISEPDVCVECPLSAIAQSLGYRHCTACTRPASTLSLMITET